MLLPVASVYHLLYDRCMKIIRLPHTVKALIFDIDQTLYDNREYYELQKTLLMQRLARKMEVTDAEMTDIINKAQADFAAQNEGRKLSLGNLFLRFGVSIEESCTWRDELFEPEAYLSLDRKLILTMEELASAYRLAAVTNTTIVIAERTLAVLGVKDFFPDIISLDCTFVSKPHAKPFTLAAEKTGVAFENIIALGDRFDIDVELPVQMGMGGIVTENIDDIYRLPEILRKNSEKPA